MTPELLYAVLVFLAAVFGLLVLFLDRSNKRTSQVVMGLLDVAAALAKATPDTRDDALVEDMRRVWLADSGPDPLPHDLDPEAQG